MKADLKTKKIIPDSTDDKIAGVIIAKQKGTIAADAISDLETLLQRLGIAFRIVFLGVLRVSSD